MSYACKILADSVSPEGHRLTTFEVTFPRFILAEVNTHRMLSRNSASSRAIPVKKSIIDVSRHGFMPEAFGVNEPGMVASKLLNDSDTLKAFGAWNDALDAAVTAAHELDQIEVHKGIANRVLEPYKWHTAILTATDWDNFFALRTDANAQPEFRKIALMMQEQYEATTESSPWVVEPGGWHLPLVNPDEMYPVDPNWNKWTQISVGRCARVSYLTHDGRRDPDADVELANKLKTNGHLSPFEHVATPFTEEEWHMIRYLQNEMVQVDPLISNSEYARLCRNLEYDGNLRGWHSYRSFIPNQDNFAEVKANALH